MWALESQCITYNMNIWKFIQGSLSLFGFLTPTKQQSILVLVTFIIPTIISLTNKIKCIYGSDYYIHIRLNIEEIFNHWYVGQLLIYLSFNLLTFSLPDGCLNSTSIGQHIAHSMTAIWGAFVQLYKDLCHTNMYTNTQTLKSLAF